MKGFRGMPCSSFQLDQGVERGAGRFAQHAGPQRSGAVASKRHGQREHLGDALDGKRDVGVAGTEDFTGRGGDGDPEPVEGYRCQEGDVGRDRARFPLWPVAADDVVQYAAKRRCIECCGHFLPSCSLGVLAHSWMWSRATSESRGLPKFRPVTRDGLADPVVDGVLVQLHPLAHSATSSEASKYACRVSASSASCRQQGRKAAVAERGGREVLDRLAEEDLRLEVVHRGNAPVPKTRPHNPTGPR